MSAARPAGPALAGERRQLTALFYDIVDSTALLHELDPEDFGIAQRAIHLEAAAAIRSHGGHVEHIQGDGGCAFFGYPEPTEDAAECAVAAALELVERCKAVAGELGCNPPLQVRAGVATGEVVLSHGLQTGLPVDHEIIGIAPALASRIQAEAKPNSVVVADTTHRIVQPAFEFESLGLRPLKGFSQPQPLWRPLCKRASADRFSRLRRPDMPLIGRDDELNVCRARWAIGRSGRGQVVLVVGEAGIGKSRLIAEFRHEIASGGHEVRLLQCEPRGDTRPLLPLLDLLRREINGATGDTVNPSPRAIRDYFRRIAPSASDEMAALFSFLFGVGSNDRASSSGFESLPSSELKERVLGAALGLLRAWCRSGPQVLIVEDAHWADTLTTAFLTRMIEEAHDLPLLLIVTSREQAFLDARDAPNVVPLLLSRLDYPAVSRFIAAIWAPLVPPCELSGFVHDKSDGIPLFVEELTTLVRDRFSDSPTDVTEWERILHSEGIITLRDFISARLASLGGARRVAQIASTIGREFSLDLLMAITQGAESVPELDEHLAKLMNAGLVSRRSMNVAITFRFRHMLIQEAAYHSLLKSEQREFHDRIVRAVLARRVAPLPDDVMAWHCDHAGRPLEAAQFAIRAAESCAIRSAMHEAEHLLSTAEAHLSRCKPGPKVEDLMLELCETRGPVVIELFGKSSAEARATYEKGVAICSAIHPDDRDTWFPLYWGWWFTAPDLGVQNARARILLRDSATTTDEVRLQSLHCGWATHFHAGNHSDCLACIEQGLALYDPDRAVGSRAKFGGHDAKVCALAERGLSQWLQGDPRAAAHSLETALGWAEEIGHVGSLSHALDVAIVGHWLREDVDNVAAFASRMQQMAKENNLPGLKAKSSIFGGWARALRESLADGLQELEEGLQLQRAIGTEEDLPIHIELWADLLARSGNYDAGIRAVDDALRRAHDAGNAVWLPVLYRRRGLFKRAKGSLSWLQDLQRSLDESERQGARAFAARARTDLDRTLSP